LPSATFLLTDLNLACCCIVTGHMLDATNVWASPSMHLPWMALCSYRLAVYFSPLVDHIFINSKVRSLISSYLYLKPFFLHTPILNIFI
jgi:hypothetical protein